MVKYEIKQRRKNVAMRFKPVVSFNRLNIEIAIRITTRKRPKYGSIENLKPLEYTLKKRDVKKQCS